MSFLKLTNTKFLVILSLGVAGVPGVSLAQTAQENADRCFEQAILLGTEYDRLGTEEAKQKSIDKLNECLKLSEIANEESHQESQKLLRDLQQAVDDSKRAIAERLQKDGVLPKGGNSRSSKSFKAAATGNGYPPSWVTLCAEFPSKGIVRCEGYGGFAREYGNLPAACEANNLVVCRMTLCELSTYVPIFSSTRPWVFDDRILACSSNGIVNGRRQFYGFQ